MKNFKFSSLVILLMAILLVISCKQFNNLAKDDSEKDKTKKTKIDIGTDTDYTKDKVKTLSVDKKVNGIPIPKDSNITSNKENEGNHYNWKRRIIFTNSASVYSVGTFVKEELEKDGWKGSDRNKLGDLITNLDFEKDSEKLDVYITDKSDSSSVRVTIKEKFPMHPKSSGGNSVNINGKLTLTTNVPESKNVVADFYKEKLSSQGWKMNSKPIDSNGTMILNFSKKNQKVMISLSESENSTSVDIRM